MEHPAEHFGRYGGHAEIVYEDVRVPADALLGGEGEGFLIAQHRLGPGRIHHCMRWLGVSQRAFDMLCERALSRYAFGSVLSDKQTVQNWIADSAAQMQAARLMTLHAAWRMDNEGASAARTDISLDQVLRRECSLRRRRPRAADPWRARLLDRPAAGGDVPLRPRRAPVRRRRRGPPPVGRPPDPARLRGRTRCRPSTSRPAARRLARASPTCSRPSARMTSRMLAAFACAFLLGACGGGGATTAAGRARRRRRPSRRPPTPTAAAAKKVDRFDEDRAWKTLEYQVKLGPRPAGSETSQASSPPTSRRGSRTPTSRRCPAACATSSARSPARASRSCSPPTTTPRTSRTSWAPTTARAARRRCSRSRACCSKTKRAEERAADLVRRLRRRGGHRRRRLLRHRPARLQAVRGKYAQADQGARPARLRRRQGPRDPVRGRARTPRCGRTCARPPSASARDSAFPDTRAGRRRGRPHAVHPPRRARDRPDRLQLPLLAQDLRRPHRRVQGVPGQERRGRAGVPQERAERAQDRRAPSARRRRRSSPSPTPRCGSPRGRARRSRRPSTCRRPGCARRRSAARRRAPG